MTQLVIRGVDITSTETLPGCVLVLGSSGIINREMATEITELLGLPKRYAATAVPQETYDRDVQFHGTTESSPYSIARVPIVVGKSDSKLKESQRFVVRAKEYDPKVHTGEASNPIVELHDVVGMSPFGLEIVAHNADGIKAACAWCGSDEGRSVLAKMDFVEHVVESSSVAHFRVDGDAKVGTVAPFKTGDVVVVVGEEDECLVVLKVTDTSVQVKDGAEKKRWLRWEQVQLSTVQT